MVLAFERNYCSEREDLQYEHIYSQKWRQGKNKQNELRNKHTIQYYKMLRSFAQFRSTVLPSTDNRTVSQYSA